MDISKFIKQKDEKPLDNIVSDGGLCSILRKIICVGDSLSSGEFETLNADNKKSYYDMFDYSWGQHIARIAGVKVLNYSRGGMSAKEYCESYANSKGWWNIDEKANAYFIALGVNDINQQQELGKLSDIDDENCENNKDTFIGWYAKIIQRYKKISPDAKFFLITMPYLPNNFKEQYDKANNLFYQLAEKFSNTYVIDLHKYGPNYLDPEFRKNFFLNGHLNPSGYLLTAKMIVSYVDYIIRNNPTDFNCVGLMNQGIITNKI